MSAPAGEGSSARTRVKLCGMFRNEDMEAILHVRPDLCGFVVDFPRSHRSVTPRRLIELCQRLDALEKEAGESAGSRIARVGVFVDKRAAEVVRIARAADLDAVQLHGNEDNAYIAALRKIASELRPPQKDSKAPLVIQAFRIREPHDVRRAALSAADMVLLDGGQGSGCTFDWSMTKGLDRPFLLAGGLDPDNVAVAVRTVRPWGVDMSSGIETNQVKNEDKMRAAVAAVGKADADLQATSKPTTNAGITKTGAPQQRPRPQREKGAASI